MIPRRPKSAVHLDIGDIRASKAHVLFDACVLAHLHPSRREPGRPWQAWWEAVKRAVPKERRHVNDVVLWELYRRPREIRPVREWVSSEFMAERLPSDALERFSLLLRHHVERALPIGGPADGLLIAHACARNWVITTLDVDHFDVRGVRLLVPSANRA